MEVVVTADVTVATQLAADAVQRVLATTDWPVLGLATGATPAALYAALVHRFRERQLSFAATTTFNLDEYVGLPAGHRAAYSRYMREHLFDHVDIAPSRAHIPDGAAEDLAGASAAYEAAIAAAGGIDLQVLGIGATGHIGFNEPMSSLMSRTRIKSLTRRTRVDNAAAFGGAEAVPLHVLTMGVGTILDARHVLVLAFGARKASAVAAMVEGPVTARVPASALQLHPSVRVLVDEEAAADLEFRDYYDEIAASKPAWQLWPPSKFASARRASLTAEG